jgi:hypothetical protein
MQAAATKCLLRDRHLAQLILWDTHCARVRLVSQLSSQWRLSQRWGAQPMKLTGMAAMAGQAVASEAAKEMPQRSQQVQLPSLDGLLQRIAENNLGHDQIPNLTPFQVQGRTVGYLKPECV